MKKDESKEVRELTPEEQMEERVPVMLFLGPNMTDDVPVTVNGETIIIKRGRQVMVKRKHALVLASQYAQQLVVHQLQESLAKQE